MGDLVEQQFQPVIDLSKMPESDLVKAKEIASGIDIHNSQAIIQYGVGAQKQISSFADTILDEIRSKDAGFVGEYLSELMLNIKDVGVDKLSEQGGLFSNAPVLRGIGRKVRKFMSRFEKLSTQIDKIINELNTARMNLLKDITMLDNLYEKNTEYLNNLDIYIAAGQLKIEEIRNVVIPEMKKKVEESGDAMDAQKLQDLGQLLNRFEKKIYDMKLSRMIALQTAPQVRLIQNNNEVLVEKIQSSILNTIPLWKNQIIIAIGIFRQKKALEVQKKVTDTTNELLAKNSEMLKQASLGVARESERGIVEIETLKKVNTDLISTIEETLKIQQEGRAKREQAEQELVTMENELKQKLAAVAE